MYKFGSSFAIVIDSSFRLDNNSFPLLVKISWVGFSTLLISSFDVLPKLTILVVSFSGTILPANLNCSDDGKIPFFCHASGPPAISLNSSIPKPTVLFNKGLTVFEIFSSFILINATIAPATGSAFKKNILTYPATAVPSNWDNFLLMYSTTFLIGSVIGLPMLPKLLINFVNQTLMVWINPSICFTFFLIHWVAFLAPLNDAPIAPNNATVYELSLTLFHFSSLLGSLIAYRKSINKIKTSTPQSIICTAINPAPSVTEPNATPIAVCITCIDVDCQIVLNSKNHLYNVDISDGIVLRGFNLAAISKVFLSTPKLFGYHPCGPNTSDCGICGLLNGTGFAFAPADEKLKFGYSPGFKVG